MNLPWAASVGIVLRVVDTPCGVLGWVSVGGVQRAGRGRAAWAGGSEGHGEGMPSLAPPTRSKPTFLDVPVPPYPLTLPSYPLAISPC